MSIIFLVKIQLQIWWKDACITNVMGTFITFVDVENVNERHFPLHFQDKTHSSFREKGEPVFLIIMYSYTI